MSKKKQVALAAGSTVVPSTVALPKVGDLLVAGIHPRQQKLRVTKVIEATRLMHFNILPN